jgi:hypothetical protein
MSMRFRFLSSAPYLMLACTLSLHAAPAMPAAPASPELTTTFTVNSPTQVPGEKLKPGTYSITVLDHLSDRIVLRIDGSKGKVHDTFLAVRNPSLLNASAPGPIAWNKGGEHEGAMRGFSFANVGAVEFVYPKEEAVVIAKKNGDKVPAIDPASEGRVAAKDLSDEDRQMVTLWMLSPTTVGAGGSAQPAIEAERYQAPQTGPAAPAPQVAQNTPPPQPSTRNQQAAPPASAQVARLHKPVLARLPHTASDLPLIFLVGILSLLGATVLGAMRGSRNVA